MNDPVQLIPLSRLALTFLPVAIVVSVHFSWTRAHGAAIYAMLRMLVQLLLIGYLLIGIFRADNPWLIGAVVATMIVISAWIALHTVARRRRHWLPASLLAIVAGGGLSLFLATQLTLEIDPWYAPQQLIPLAGMAFASAMNSVSLAAERYQAERLKGSQCREARNTAFGSSLIPITNSLFAVGLVSLPGMMTGQILSGVDPLIAARYQIMIMGLIYSASGIASAIFLVLLQRQDGRLEAA